MATIHAGFFAVPPRYIDELALLHRRYRHAYDEVDDDFEVRANHLYRRAAECALHGAVCSGQSMFDAFVEVTHLVSARLWRGDAQVVFGPRQVQALVRAMDERELLVGGADIIARGLVRKHPDLCLDAVRDVYRACKDVLGRALRESAVFLWAEHDDEAEDELARRRSAARRLVPSVEDEVQFRQYWHDMQQRLRVPAAEDSPASDLVEHVTLCLIRDAAVPTVGKAFEWAWKAIRDPESTRGAELEQTAQIWALEEAAERIALRAYGEASAIDPMHRLLGSFDPGAYQQRGVYTAVQARELWRALERWEATYGARKLIDSATYFAYGRDRAMVVRAYERLRRALEQAATRELGLVIVTVSP
jgi:hypothetical protein